MFGRRRKLKDEEESLVPHGLVWQATDEAVTEASPLDMPANQPAARTPIEMPVRRSEPEAQVESPAVPAQPPLGWPRVEGEEIIRRAEAIDTAVSFPYRNYAPAMTSAGASHSSVTPIKPVHTDRPWNSDDDVAGIWSAPVVSPVEKTPVRFSLPSWPNLKLVHSRNESGTNLGSRLRRKLELVFLQARMLGTRSWSSASAWFAQAGSSVRSHIGAVNVRKPAASVRDFSTRQAQQWDSSSTQLRQAPRRDSGKFQNATAAWSARFRRGVDGSRLMLLDASRRLRQSAASIWRYEVKIRIRGIAAPGIASMGRSAMLRINLLRARARRDERLWTSLAMAGASAILALVVISGLRHYDAVRAGSETPSANHAIPAQQSPAAEPITPRPQTTVAPASVATTTLKPVVSERTEKSDNSVGPQKLNVGRKPHSAHRYNSDEDYVADDTYKYYGPAGKPSSR